jgi:hypothetical protein
MNPSVQTQLPFELHVSFILIQDNVTFILESKAKKFY